MKKMTHSTKREVSKKIMKLKVKTIKSINEISLQEIELFDGTKFVLLPEGYICTQNLLMGKDRYFITKID